jgi:sugar phosphate isomerase/epimerase
LTKPEISISSCFDYNVPLDKQIPLIAEAGFTHISLGSNTEHSGITSRERRQQLKNLLNHSRISIDTIHSPQLVAPGGITRVRETIAAAADLKVPIVVVHIGPFELDESELTNYLTSALNLFGELEPVLKETGIRLALENLMPGPATALVVQSLARLNPRHFGFCYDSSHEQIDGPRPFELLDSLRDRVIAVHLSDRIREYVDHVPPGEGFIDWPALTASLKKTSFTGPLLFEVMVEHSSEKETRAFLKLAYERACHVHTLMHNVTRNR